MFNNTRERLLAIPSLFHQSKAIEITLQTANDTTYEYNSETMVPYTRAMGATIAAMTTVSLISGCNVLVCPTACATGLWLGDNIGYFIFETIKYIAEDIPENAFVEANVTESDNLSRVQLHCFFDPFRMRDYRRVINIESGIPDATEIIAELR